MNFLFSLAQGAASAAVLWVIYLAIPKALWDAMPSGVMKWKKPAATFLASMIAVFVTVNSAMTYGPRYSLSSSSQAPTPESVEVEKGKQFIHKTERVGQFDEKINATPSPR